MVQVAATDELTVDDDSQSRTAVTSRCDDESAMSRCRSDQFIKPNVLVGLYLAPEVRLDFREGSKESLGCARVSGPCGR